ncbi:hypothetical protein BH09SUM1_BH09SUM1_01030 [soil metagenome]
MSHPVETYLHDIIEIRRSGAGTKETSYYGALSSVLNAVGKDLKPKVRCIVQLASQGSGHPDLGLFTADQFQRGGNTDPQLGQKPSRGVIEVKATSADVRKTARTEQVKKYLAAYVSCSSRTSANSLSSGRILPRDRRRNWRSSPLRSTRTSSGAMRRTYAGWPMPSVIAQGTSFVVHSYRLRLSPSRQMLPSFWPATPAKPLRVSRTPTCPRSKVRSASSSPTRKANASFAAPSCRRSSTASSRRGSLGRKIIRRRLVLGSTGTVPPGTCACR